MKQTLPPRVRHAQRAGFIAWALLLLLQPLWHAWWVPPTQGSGLTTALVAAVPLLLPLLALRRPARALLWASMLALFYFSHGIATAWSMPEARAPALLETLFSLAIVLALGAGIQRRPRKPVVVPDKPGP